MTTRNQKITLGEMRASGVRGLLIYCSDYKCSHWTAISGDKWRDEVRLSELEAQFICSACGTKGADVRPDFDWERKTAPAGRAAGAAISNSVTTGTRGSSPSG